SKRDWSSDVCSSDLGVVDHRSEEVCGGQDRQILAHLDRGGVVAVVEADEDFITRHWPRRYRTRAIPGQPSDRFLQLTSGNLAREIGRASCREAVEW